MLGASVNYVPSYLLEKIAFLVQVSGWIYFGGQ